MFVGKNTKKGADNGLWLFNSKVLKKKTKEPYRQCLVSLFPEVVCLSPTETHTGFIAENLKKAYQQTFFYIAFFSRS